MACGAWRVAACNVDCAVLGVRHADHVGVLCGQHAATGMGDISLVVVCNLQHGVTQLPEMMHCLHAYGLAFVDSAVVPMYSPRHR